MSTKAQTLAEFLLARIEEAEAEARGPLDDAEYMWARRALAECEAKRRIVERFRWVDRYPRGMPLDNLAEANEWEPAHDTLCDLASAYADHPDYQGRWRP